MAKLLNAYLDYTSNDKPIKDRKIFVSLYISQTSNTLALQVNINLNSVYHRKREVLFQEQYPDTEMYNQLAKNFRLAF